MTVFRKLCWILVFVPLAGFARADDECRSEQTLFGAWIFNRYFTVADGCLVQVTPRDKPGLVYREYVFDEAGRWMVFDSIDGPYETSTAQRNYFLLPAHRRPSFERRGDRMVVTTASGTEARFSASSRFLDSAGSDLIFEEEPEISMKPGGHFRILGYDGVLLDAGWKIGDRAYRDRAGTSTFLKRDFAPCAFRNTELFAYDDRFAREDYYQPVFRYSDPEALAELIRERCDFGK